MEELSPKLPPLTWLYVPGDRPRMIESALASNAEAVVIDLEDAVLDIAKDRARAIVVELLSTVPSKPVFVRVNHISTPWAIADVEALGSTLGVSGFRAPKVESAADLAYLLPATRVRERDIAIHCLIESAVGLEGISEIATHPAVSGISLGETDLRAQLGLIGDAGLAWARGRVVVAAAAAGLPPPVQSVYPILGDPEGLLASCRLGRSLGFLGRSAIHPQQLDVIVEGYLPAQREVEEAREVIAAFSGMASGSIALADGRMVDAAVLQAARRCVALADRYGIG